jgi:hypothetical protein
MPSDKGDNIMDKQAHHTNLECFTDWLEAHVSRRGLSTDGIVKLANDEYIKRSAERAEKEKKAPDEIKNPDTLRIELLKIKKMYENDGDLPTSSILRIRKGGYPSKKNLGKINQLFGQPYENEVKEPHDVVKSLCIQWPEFKVEDKQCDICENQNDWSITFFVSNISDNGLGSFSAKQCAGVETPLTLCNYCITVESFYKLAKQEGLSVKDSQFSFNPIVVGLLHPTRYEMLQVLIEIYHGQEQLATKLGTDQSTINKIVNKDVEKISIGLSKNIIIHYFYEVMFKAFKFQSESQTEAIGLKEISSKLLAGQVLKVPGTIHNLMVDHIREATERFFGYMQNRLIFSDFQKRYKDAMKDLLVNQLGYTIEDTPVPKTEFNAIEFQEKREFILIAYGNLSGFRIAVALAEYPNDDSVLLSYVNKAQGLQATHIIFYCEFTKLSSLCLQIHTPPATFTTIHPNNPLTAGIPLEEKHCFRGLQYVIEQAPNYIDEFIGEFLDARPLWDGVTKYYGGLIKEIDKKSANNVQKHDELNAVEKIEILRIIGLVGDIEEIRHGVSFEVAIKNAIQAIEAGKMSNRQYFFDDLLKTSFKYQALEKLEKEVNEDFEAYIYFLREMEQKAKQCINERDVPSPRLMPSPR